MHPGRPTLHPPPSGVHSAQRGCVPASENAPPPHAPSQARQCNSLGLDSDGAQTRAMRDAMSSRLSLWPCPAPSTSMHGVQAAVYLRTRSDPNRGGRTHRNRQGVTSHSLLDGCNLGQGQGAHGRCPRGAEEDALEYEATLTRSWVERTDGIEGQLRRSADAMGFAQ